ncbi:Gfo/Idh/MocA family oxidoreductase [Tsukamurella conjunctivitidis]|uniref:Gfo/Idh/MocA family oxidoreductase n=2 Tax=Tsukamurella TaxID=2060 RepID=A0A5C5RZ28_9ACTN|nr:Gfo/Idh/MocA family oxidoreductase [Tsukamurella columbiensis]TWS28367.1 Gfo/Idh/MocA family oxidoreductase [Tsukamurella conjunctivitidis]
MRIGLVGAGPWARETHAPALTAHPGVEFVGGWARDPAAAAEVFPRSFDSPAALFDAVDAVAFAVPPNVQAPLAEQAARAGKHVVLDKPIALDLAGATALADAVAAAGVRSIVAFTRRFAPETREFVRAAAALRPIAAEAQWLSGAALSGKFAASTWRQEQGALFDVGPHVLDLLDAVAGPITGVDAACYDAASDTWTAQLTHAGGAASSVSLSLRTPVLPTVLRVCAHSGDGLAVLESRETPSTECFRVLLDEFLDVIATGGDHPLDVRHGLHVQRIIDLIRAAAGPTRR